MTTILQVWGQRLEETHCGRYDGERTLNSLLILENTSFKVTTPLGSHHESVIMTILHDSISYTAIRSTLCDVRKGGEVLRLTWAKAIKEGG